MTYEERKRLAKHYKEIGYMDHPYVLEFYPEKKEEICSETNSSFQESGKDSTAGKSSIKKPAIGKTAAQKKEEDE